nr:ferrous iron transport protein A [Arcanobacterium haemolyticum]
MGLRVGAEGVVSQHAGYGGLILTIAGARIAIDHRSAQLIEAEVLN